MAMNPLPPQAYTKETMLKAYQWLMGQSSSIKEMATTPDILVSLYLKASRDGSAALDRPSIQNFKNELRSLAGMMGELDRPVTTKTESFEPRVAKQLPLQPQLQPQLTAQPVQLVRTAELSAEAAPPAQVFPPEPATPASALPQTSSAFTEKTLAALTITPDAVELLDVVSRSMIQEVKTDFNLSTDVEALRMLIKIGYSRAKALLR